MLDAVAALAKGLMYGALLSASGVPLAAAFLSPSEALRDYALRVMRIAAVAAIALNLLIAAPACLLCITPPIAAHGRQQNRATQP